MIKLEITQQFTVF